MKGQMARKARVLLATPLLTGLLLTGAARAGQTPLAVPEKAATPTKTGQPAAPAKTGQPAVPAKTGQPAGAKAPPVAVIGVLDKRQGKVAEFTLKPGENFQFGRLTGTLRTCDRTHPYERQQSAAFVQVIDQPPTLRGRPAPKPVVAFSGWLFAELPSLNPFVHPVYDVWLKNCTIHFPDGPPATSRPPAGATRARARPSSGSTTPAPAAPPALPPPATGQD